MTRPGGRLPFEAATNFRDIGGYPAMRGGTVRRGVVYRSDGLQALTQADLTLYKSLGIATAFDLRRDSEAARMPNPVPTVRLCMMESVDRATGASRDRRLVTSTRDGEEMMRDGYVAMARHSAAVIGRIVTEVAAGTRPVVFHCHGGKDRTGVTAAVLLDLLGVERDVVLDDYELTSTYRRFADQESSYNELVAQGMAREAAMAMLGTPRWAMAEALDVVDGLGGARDYLTTFGGVSPADLDTFTDLMLDTTKAP